MRPYRKIHDWSGYDVFIKEFYMELSDGEMAKRLGISQSATQHRRRVVLKLYRVTPTMHGEPRGRPPGEEERRMVDYRGEVREMLAMLREEVGCSENGQFDAFTKTELGQYLIGRLIGGMRREGIL